ncbi:MAG: septum formation initiator family protein [Mycoplasmatota bacterium]|nr:septum formation initiator family protein [Mycoplasmatota bacterium]
MASTKKNSKKKRTRRMLLLGLGSLAIIVTLTLTIGKYWIEIIEKYNEKKELEDRLVQLQEEEKALKLDASKLQDPDYVARYAREKYLYSKDGEFIIKIPKE